MDLATEIEKSALYNQIKSTLNSRKETLLSAMSNTISEVAQVPLDVIEDLQQDFATKLDKTKVELEQQLIDSKNQLDKLKEELTPFLTPPAPMTLKSAIRHHRHKDYREQKNDLERSLYDVLTTTFKSTSFFGASVAPNELIIQNCEELNVLRAYREQVKSQNTQLAGLIINSNAEIGRHVNDKVKTIRPHKSKLIHNFFKKK